MVRGALYATLTFKGQKSIVLFGVKPGEGRDFFVRNQFCLALAELLGLKLQGQWPNDERQKMHRP